MLWLRNALLMLNKAFHHRLTFPRIILSKAFRGQCSTGKNLPCGFTLLEILIVIVVMAFLLALSAPFVSALRSEMEMEKTLRQVKTDLISTLTFALAGKSLTPLESKDKALQLPAVYALHFSTSSPDEEAHYEAFELAVDQESEKGTLHPIHEEEFDYPSPEIALKTISLLNPKEEKQIFVDSAYLFVFPPFGKVFFLSGDADFLDHLTLNALESSPFLYSDIQLNFQYKDQPSTQKTLNFTRGKVLTIF